MLYSDTKRSMKSEQGTVQNHRQIFYDKCLDSDGRIGRGPASRSLLVLCRCIAFLPVDVRTIQSPNK